MRYCDMPMAIQNAINNRDVSAGDAECMTKRELFHEYCEWHGLINWSDTLWRVMQELQKSD
jgi:hypothetical protein